MKLKKGILQEHFNKAFRDYDFFPEKILEEIREYFLEVDEQSNWPGILAELEQTSVIEESHSTDSHELNDCIVQAESTFVLDDATDLTKLLSNESLFISEPYTDELALSVMIFLFSSKNSTIISQFIPELKIKGLIQSLLEKEKRNNIKHLIDAILCSRNENAINTCAPYLKECVESLEKSPEEKTAFIKTILHTPVFASIICCLNAWVAETAGDPEERSKRIRAILSSHRGRAIRTIIPYLDTWVTSAEDRIEKMARILKIVTSQCNEAMQAIKKHFDFYIEDVTTFGQKIVNYQNLNLLVKSVLAVPDKIELVQKLIDSKVDLEEISEQLDERARAIFNALLIKVKQSKGKAAKELSHADNSRERPLDGGVPLAKKQKIPSIPDKLLAAFQHMDKYHICEICWDLSDLPNIYGRHWGVEITNRGVFSLIEVKDLNQFTNALKEEQDDIVIIEERSSPAHAFGSSRFFNPVINQASLGNNNNNSHELGGPT